MRRATTAAVLLVVSVVVGGCGSSDDLPDRAERSTTTTTSPARPGSDNSTALKDAGKQSDLLIGTAAKFGDPEREALQVREFNAITAENEFVWSQIHPGPDEWNYERADRVVAFAEDHDLDLTATHFLWDPPAIRSVVPDWVRAITDPGELREVMREHFRTLHDRYGGKIDRWNVVNEPVAITGGLEQTSHFRQVLGPGYVTEAFEVAEEIWPEAELVVNEVLTEYFSAKADPFVALVEELLDGGARVDRVGLQGHLLLGEPDWTLIEQTMGRLADLGVTVDVTEIDIPLSGVNEGLPPIDLDTQAEWAGRLVRICLDQPACGSITFWGFDDGDTWLDDFIRPGTQPLLYDEDLDPKPMHDAVLEELLAGR